MVCSPLNPPQNGALDTTDLSHGTVVTASCLPGFKFPDGSLSTQLECISDGSPQPVAVWDASVIDCQRPYRSIQFSVLYYIG